MHARLGKTVSVKVILKMDDLNDNSVLKNLKEESPFEDAFREMSFKKKPGSSPKPALMLVNSDKTYTNCNESILLFISLLHF